MYFYLGRHQLSRSKRIHPCSSCFVLYLELVLIGLMEGTNELVRFYKKHLILHIPHQNTHLTTHQQGEHFGFCKYGAIPRDGTGESLLVFSKNVIPQTFLWSCGKRVWEMCSQMAWLE